MARASSVTRSAGTDSPPRFFERIQIALISAVASLVIAVIGRTLRISATAEEGSIPTFEEIGAGVYPFWHRCVLAATWVFRDRGLAVMTSQSRDGEYIARVIRRFGFVPVRGSSSRGGLRALLEMRELIAHGQGVAFTIDGPRGPRSVAKRGPIVLARETGAAIVPFYVAVERTWVLNTWDRFIIPKPFSRAYLRAGRKIFVPADADDAAMDRCFAEMQAGLERVTAYAEEHAGAPQI